MDIRFWKVRQNDTLFLPSGKRFDVLVTGAGNETFGASAATHYDPLKVVNDQFNDDPLGTVIATMNVQGNQIVKPVSIIPTTLTFRGPGQGDLSNATIAAHRVLYWQSNDRDWIYTINNKTFNPNIVNEKVKLGTTEEWKLVNLNW